MMILLLLAVLVGSVYMSEPFANQNKNTVLDVHGQILGFDLLDFHDTFENDPPYVLNLDVI